MGGGSKQPSNTTSVTTTEPPAWARPYLQDLADRARAGTVDRPYQAFPGQRIANLNTIQQQGLNSMYARAASGSPLNATAKNTNLATVRGDYLNYRDPALNQVASGDRLSYRDPYLQQSAEGQYLNRQDPYLKETASGRYLNVGSNPYWQAMSRDIANAYATGVAAQTDAAFSGGRNYGGSAYNEVVQRNQKGLADSLGNLAGQIYQGERGMQESARSQLAQQYAQERANQLSAQNILYGGYQQERANQIGAMNQLYGGYQQERGNQLSAMQFAPQLAETDYADIDRALSVGDILRENEQDIINARYEDWFNAQEYPREMLDLYSVLLNRAMGGGSQSTVRQPNLYRPNRTAGALGGAMAGYSMGNSLSGGSGYGQGIGAALGGLLGAFG